VELSLFLPLVLPVLLGPAARPLTGRLDPRPATWLLTACALVLAGSSLTALGLLAAAAVVRLPAVAGVGHWSVAALGGQSVAGGISAAAGVLFLTALAAMTAFLVRRIRALRAAFGEARGLRSGADGTVVVRDPAVDAYALPGRPGRIVVTTGMLATLDETGRAALIAHERAHLAGRHHLFTGAARLAAAANPLLRPMADAVDFSVERWADETAARSVADRGLVARAIARAALAARADTRRADGAPARAHLAAGQVPLRVAALLRPPPPLGLPVLAALAALAAAAGLCSLQATDHLQDRVSTAQIRVHDHGRGPR
jgi:Peptidase family M48